MARFFLTFEQSIPQALLYRRRTPTAANDAALVTAFAQFVGRSEGNAGLSVRWN
jgi:hypothetical protein